MDLADLWKKAVQKYEEESKLKLPSDLPNWTASDLSADSILREVEKRQGDFKHFREHKEGLRNALKPFSTVIKSTAEIVNHSVKRIFPPAEAICAATVLLLKTADGVGANYNAIRDMLEAISGFLLRLDGYTKGNDVNSIGMKRMVVENLAQVLTILGLAAKAIKEKRTIAYFKELIGKNSKIQEAMTKLEQLSIREGQTVGATALSAAKKILGHLETRLKDDTDNAVAVNKMLLTITREAEAIFNVSQQNHLLLEDIRHSMSNIPAHIVSEHDRAVREWLNAPDSSSNFHEAHRKRTPGTGAWLIRDERYKEWKNGNTRQSIFWLSGRPGCGKSVLSSKVIEDISLEIKADPDVSIAYFYFDFRDPRKQDRRSLALSLVDQMSFAFSKLPSCLDQLYLNRRSSSSQPSYEDLLAALQQICSDRQSLTYFVIDGLDECKRNEWYDLAAMLESIENWELDTLRVLCTSRREEELAEGLSAISKEIDLESSVVNADIETYIGMTLEKDPRFTRWRNRKAEKDEIMETLTTRANGMFRWAFCQLESLAKCISRKDLRKALQNLPKTLYDTYERMLQNIDEDHHQYAHAVLQCLCISHRKMVLKEIAELLAFNHDNDPPTFEEEDRLPEPRDILRICSSLVVCTKDRLHIGGEWKESDCLELAHFSVKEYLLSEHTGYATRFSVNAQLAHTFIAQLCLAYLLQFTEPVGYDTLDKYPLSYYAAEYWADHYRDGGFCLSQDTVLALLCSDTEQYNNWIRICDPDKSNRPCVNLKADDIARPLYHAALAGLVPIIEALLTKGPDVNIRGGLHATALQAASFNSKESVVKLLLDNGAVVNALGGHFGTALQAASYSGKESVVKLLLNNGADVKALGGYFGTALQAASFNGNKSVVKLLLDHGANVNALGGHYGTALQAAYYFGNTSVGRILLDNGADVNAQGGEYGTPLQAAAASFVSDSDKSTVRLLLDHGADVNALGGCYGTALQAASARGKISIIKVLLIYGAHVNIHGGQYGTALQAAAASGNLSIVQLLLNHGADVHGWGATALQAAAFNSHELIVELLLDYGANVNLRDKNYRTAMQLALESRDRINVMRVLLERGAYVRYCSNDKGHRFLRRTPSTPNFDGRRTYVATGPPRAPEEARGVVDDLWVRYRL